MPNQKFLVATGYDYKGHAIMHTAQGWHVTRPDWIMIDCASEAEALCYVDAAVEWEKAKNIPVMQVAYAQS